MGVCEDAARGERAMKIFVSSTFDDLEDHRRAVREAILRLGHQPIGMEDFGSRPETWNKAALDAIDGCGALVGIYAHRYGSIPTGDALSITEQEFDRAQALGISCFCYLVDPKHPWLPDFIDSGEAKTRLETLLEKVNDLLRSQFTTPDNLANQVSADLGRELGEETVPATLTLSALHSLPSAPADFTGRQDEVDQITRHLSGGEGAAISGLTGMGGIGKTALALIVAHKLAPSYPDAQIFIDLKGTSPTPLRSADVMLKVIHAFEPQADLRKASEEEIASIYHTILATKRALLLMDNAADAAQVKPLLPPPTCALLVTSRLNFTLPGLQPLRLDVLPNAEARDLLLRLCVRAEDCAEEITRLCGYLPLAIRIAGSALAEHIDLSCSDYVTRLADHRTRLATLKSEDDPDLNVEASFELSYTLLLATQQITWRALAVFPAPFRWQAAAEVCGLSNEKTRQYLSELVRYSLVNYDEANSRYNLHNLLAEFADNRLSKRERKKAQARHARYYLKVAQEANTLYERGGNRMLTGLTLFDAEWVHIQAGQAWSTSNRKTSDELLQLCNSYPLVCNQILNLRLHPRSMLSWSESALEAARKLNSKNEVGMHLTNIGAAYALLGESQNAISYFDHALAIFHEIGDRQGEGGTLGNLGLAYADSGDERNAIEYYEQSLAISREIGDRRMEGYELGNLGLAFADLNEPRKALEFYEQALAIARETGERRAIGFWLGNMGEAQQKQGAFGKAIEYCDQALAIAQEIGDRQNEGKWLYSLGDVYAELGQTDKAIELTESALKLLEAIESPDAQKTRQKLEELKTKQNTK
jgi:tetratricopeptide (TPR) repeat protein